MHAIKNCGAKLEIKESMTIWVDLMKEPKMILYDLSKQSICMVIRQELMKKIKECDGE